MTLKLTGKKFGSWTVLHRAKNKNKRSHWKCRCECGEIVNVCGTSLVSGKSKRCESCGYEHIKTHGGSRTRLYEIWRGIFNRCYSKNDTGYGRYGLRGIRVSNCWKNFETFRKWSMANGYEDHLTLERVDNDGNYEPSNCTWITRNKQMWNTRRNLMFTIGDETKCLAEWCKIFEADYSRVHYRIRLGWHIEKALVTPRIEAYVRK